MLLRYPYGCAGIRLSASVVSGCFESFQSADIMKSVSVSNLAHRILSFFTIVSSIWRIDS